MRRALPFVFPILLLPAVAPAAGQESPQLTTLRQLDLAAQHLAATARRHNEAAELTDDQNRLLTDLAALVRGFRFEIEFNSLSGMQAIAAWDEVAETFVAARKALGDDGSRQMRNEVLRVHSLMNRLDRGFGGTGFWQGDQGWTG